MINNKECLYNSEDIKKQLIVLVMNDDGKSLVYELDNRVIVTLSDYAYFCEECNLWHLPSFTVNFTKCDMKKDISG